MATETETTTYRFNGSKQPGVRTRRLILEGTHDNPERYVDRGETIGLTEEEHASLSKSYKFTKVNKDGSDDDENREGSAGPAETREEQQAQQAESTGVSETATNPPSRSSGRGK